MSLSILSHIADLNPELIKSRILPRINRIANYNWWENKCLAIIVFSKVIKGIVYSEKYQQYIKNPAANQKFFSVEIEKQVTEMKEQIDKFAKGIYIAAYPPNSDMIITITFINIVEHLSESKVLLELFLKLILQCNYQTRNWVLDTAATSNNVSGEVPEEKKQAQKEPNSNRQGQKTHSEPPQTQPQQEEEQKSQPQNYDKKDDLFVYMVNNDKSLKYKANINNQIIKDNAPQILQTLVDFIKDESYQDLSPDYMDIIVFGFQYTDFKVINMESCEQITNVIKGFVYYSLIDEQLCQQAKYIIFKLHDLQFHSDVKITESDKLLAAAMHAIYVNNQQAQIDNIESILEKVCADAFDSGIDEIKHYLASTYNILSAKQGNDYLKSPKLKQLFEPIVEYIKKYQEKEQQQVPSPKQSNLN